MKKHIKLYATYVSLDYRGDVIENVKCADSDLAIDMKEMLMIDVGGTEKYPAPTLSVTDCCRKCFGMKELNIINMPFKLESEPVSGMKFVVIDHGAIIMQWKAA